MDNKEKDSVMTGIQTGIGLSILYIILVLAFAIGLNDNGVFYAMLGIPAVFVLAYFLGFCANRGIIKFLTPSRAREIFYKNNDYYHSEYDKDKGSVSVAILLFIPSLIFFFLFSWIFYLASTKNN